MSYTHGDSPSHHSCPHMLSSRHTARILGYTASSHCGRQTAQGCSAALKYNKRVHVVKRAHDQGLLQKSGKHFSHSAAED